MAAAAAAAATAVGQLSPPAGEGRRGGERGWAAARLGSLTGRPASSFCSIRVRFALYRSPHGLLEERPPTWRSFCEVCRRIAREAPRVRVGGGRRRRCDARVWHATGSSQPVRCFFKCASSEGDVASPPSSSPFVASVGDARRSRHRGRTLNERTRKGVLERERERVRRPRPAGRNVGATDRVRKRGWQ